MIPSASFLQSEDPLLSFNDVAALIHVPREKLDELIFRQVIKVTCIGDCHRAIRRSACKAYLQAEIARLEGRRRA